MTMGTVVGIEHIDDVEVGIIDRCGDTMKTHFIGGRLMFFGVDGGFANIEERVDEGAFTGMTAAEDDEGTVVEFALRTGLVEYL